MRRLLIITVLALLAAPSAALALQRAPGDGTLAVRNGDGFLRLDISGAVIGKLEGGQLALVSPTITDCDALGVWGADRIRTRSLPDGTTTCAFGVVLETREAMRFRLVLGPRDTLYVRNGSGLSLSAVGHGTGTIKGTGGFDGAFSLNGGLFRSLPDAGLTFGLGATLP